MSMRIKLYKGKAKDYSFKNICKQSGVIVGKQTTLKELQVLTLKNILEARGTIWKHYKNKLN